MPRNSSGVYSLPQAAFIPNSLISSAAVNSDFSDIAVALTGSLPTDGSAGMTGPFKVGRGNVGAPGIAFTSDTNTGFYLAGAHQIGWSANGAQQATFNANGSVTWQGGETQNGAATFNGATNLAGNVTLNATTYTFGAGAATGFWNGIASNFCIEAAFDGGGSAITGTSFVFVEVPCNCTVKRITILGDQSGSAGVWVGTQTFAGFAGGSGFANISSSSPFPTPNISFSGTVKAQDSTLTGWTTAITAGTILGFFAGSNTSVSNAATSVQRLTASLLVQRTGS